MNKLFAIAMLLLCKSFSAYTQTATVKGKVTDVDTKEPLIGVNIILDTKAGTTSDISGKYSLQLKPGDYIITFKFIGYRPEVKEIHLEEGEVHVMDILMKVEVHTINEIVISAGKFEQKLSDVTVSLEVIKPARIESMNTSNLDDAINHVPGVDISGEQPSIRGGSGYSYGAGSRVLVLVDDLPMLSPASGDPKWDFLPVENISQIEILKGASSALFGSSALNGVINVRTAFPENYPVTKISSSTGIYMQPERKELVWNNNSPKLFTSCNLLHSRKIGNFDLVFGSQLMGDAGYREKEFEKHGRVNTNLRYRFKKAEGLSVGVNANYMYLDKMDFFLWKSADSAYKQNLNALSDVEGTRVNVDPYVSFFSKNGHKFNLRTRYYHEEYKNLYDLGKNSFSDMYYSDLQYQKFIKDNVNLTAGTTVQYAEVKANLFGNHYSSNVGFYAQGDKKIKKLSISAGMRAEYSQVDSTQTVSQFDLKYKGDTIEFPFFPVARIGVNYQAAGFTFIRASYGQGYRFPSIAEMYTSTSIGGLNIFPNNTLKPELGESVEVGVKQGLKISNWSGYLDVAGFYTKYQNMIEYTFGIYKPPKRRFPKFPDDCGFKSINIGNAEITGVDVTFAGEGKLFTVPATILVGYTYTNPYDLNGGSDSTKSTDAEILKYRYYHSAKGDLELSYHRIVVGFSFIYTSHMVNIDKAFEDSIPNVFPAVYILPGLKEYRVAYNKGAWVWDTRISFEATDKMKISLVTKNIFNKEYMGRPGDVRPPRNVSLQFSFRF